MECSPFLGYLDEIKTVATQLNLKGWAEKNAGNFSIRIPGFPIDQLSFFSKETTDLGRSFAPLNNQVFLIKTKGACFRDLALSPKSGSALLLICQEGNAYQHYSLNGNQANFYPTSELLSHLFLQEYLILNKPKMIALLHSHPLELIIFSHIMKSKTEPELNNILRSMHVEIPILIPQGIGFIPYQEPGSIELASASLDSLTKKLILVWEKHGSLSAGKSLLDAFDLMDIANKAATIFIGLRSLGFREGIT